MANIKRLIDIRPDKHHQAILDITVADEATKQAVREIEGVREIIDIDNSDLSFTVILNRLYNLRDVIADLEALNTEMAIPDAFQE